MPAPTMIPVTAANGIDDGVSVKDTEESELEQVDVWD
jgi:hypothetical protein